MIPETENPHEAKSVRRVSLRSMLRLIRADNLGRVHNVCFLVERFICIISFHSIAEMCSKSSALCYYVWERGYYMILPHARLTAIGGLLLTSYRRSRCNGSIHVCSCLMCVAV